MKRIRETAFTWETLDQLPVEVLVAGTRVPVHPLAARQRAHSNHPDWLLDRFSNFGSGKIWDLADWTWGAFVRLSTLIPEQVVRRHFSGLIVEPGSAVPSALFIPPNRLRLGTNPLALNLLVHEIMHLLDNRQAGSREGGIGESAVYATELEGHPLYRWRRYVRPLVLPTAERVAAQEGLPAAARVAQALGLRQDDVLAGRVTIEDVAAHFKLKKKDRWESLYEFHPFTSSRASQHRFEQVLDRKPTPEELGLLNDAARLLPSGGVPFRLYDHPEELARWKVTLDVAHPQKEQLRYLMSPTEVLARVADQESRLRFKERFGIWPAGRQRAHTDLPAAACRKAGRLLDAALGELGWSVVQRPLYLSGPGTVGDEAKRLKLPDWRT